MESRWGYGIVVAVAALFATLSWLATVNEYTAVFGAEMAGAYDCDGPLFVFIFLVPAVVLALIGIGLSVRALRRRRTIAAGVALGVALLVVAAVIVRLAPAMAEARRNAAPGSPCR